MIGITSGINIPASDISPRKACTSARRIRSGNSAAACCARHTKYTQNDSSKEFHSLLKFPRLRGSTNPRKRQLN